ncbi:hypothetical protein D3C79_545670 [compost metagenome]
MTKNYYDPLSRLLHWLMAVVSLYATLAGYLMHLVIDSHPRLFQFLSVLNMSMDTLITPIFLLRWGWQHLRTPCPRVRPGTTMAGSSWPTPCSTG